MPAFAAHEIFGEEALQETKGKLNEVVAKHPEVFRLGCQGPDLFFFNPFMKLVHRKVDLGSRLHTSQINRFFEVFLDELLKLSNKQGLEIGISYFWALCPIIRWIQSFIRIFMPDPATGMA